MPEFTRYAETILKKEDKRVVSIKVKPTLTDCTGTVWFTDLMIQEGDRLSGYVINPETMLAKYDGPDVKAGKRFYNGIVRGEETIILLNLGDTSTGLDYKIYPKDKMSAGQIQIGMGSGSHMAAFTAGANKGDELDLLASSRQCLRNGATTGKNGFFQYCSAGDSKHVVRVDKGKSARIYVEFQEMKDGGD